MNEGQLGKKVNFDPSLTQTAVIVATEELSSQIVVLAEIDGNEI